MRLLTRKPVTPGEAEMAATSRSKPAKLRSAEKI
jgi:16S rRNA C1402 N4-methylase RsmH